MICNAFERLQNALKWKNGSTEFSLSLVFPNRVTNEREGIRSLSDVFRRLVVIQKLCYRDNVT